MSKEDLTCKVSSVCKHKERKPKKPHYIPRPWGKPYNYKCFQCPFTCMEKSHLYNHMKYSLCKNSLSLLIESDWPYKKGNLLHPEQLRPLQQGPRLRGLGRDETELLSGLEDQAKPQRSEVTFAEEDLEEAEEHTDQDSSRGEGAEEKQLAKESSDDTDRGTAKRCKQPETDFMITDVFSLENQLLKARSVEVEAKLKHYKLSKTCLTGPSLLSEQWRLLAASHRKAKSESVPTNTGSIPCYPPPPSFTDCQDPPGLNLSVLGVSYPLSPSLFSYVNPTVLGAAPTHAQLTQLPFLASAAQLMHPASSSLPQMDRALLPPHFYYPFLCEHAIGAAQVDASKGIKPSLSPPANINTKSPPNYPPKINLWKVPALRPSPMAPSSAWASHQHVAMSPEASYRAIEEKLQASGKEGKNSWSMKSTQDMPLVRELACKRTGAPIETHEGSSEKKTHLGYTLDVFKNIRTTPPISVATDKLQHNSSSFLTARQQSRSVEEWHSNVLKSSPENLDSEMSPPPKPAKVAERADSHEGERKRLEDQDPESAVVLLSDLSKALIEYQDAERKISHLVKEDVPGQHYLWEHLCKIRSELSHIHQALEKAARQHEGPLDLSVKKDLGTTGDGGSQCKREATKGGVIRETEEKEEVEEEEDEEGEEESETEETTASLESRRQSLDILIKMNRSGLSETSFGPVVKAEVLSPGALGLRPTPPEALWPSRTTKCEADSSVLLCPDGRPLVFTDFTSSAKNLKRPSSRQQLGDSLCPPSPLTANDS